VHPIDLPWIFKYLGGLKAEAFFGQLQGHRFIRTSTAFFGPHIDRQPYIEGAKFALKPTPNLEFGLSITSVWGGDGVPITFDSFKRSFSPGNALAGQPLDPGDRRTGFDFKYRIPGLRKWLTLYNDSMAEDEPNPIGYPRRSSHAPGLYLSHVPGIEKLDFRAEGYFTDLPGFRGGPGTWYSNNHYLSGFTNEGFLLGHPVGRQGRGYSLGSTYWFGPQSAVSFLYRNVIANEVFLQGGRIEDYAARAKWLVRQNWTLNGGVQLERWNFPVLAPTRQTNVSVNLGVMFTPNWKMRQSR
jgi:hypothetical protein